jgi:hypothetical protein
VALAFGSAAAAAEPSAQWLGDSRTALPGVHRVGVALPARERVAGAATLGYGSTEAQAGESGSHQRAAGSLGIAAAPLPWLQPALLLDARYDRHPADARGTDDGVILEGALSARAATRMGSHWLAGAELAALLPAGDDFSASASALTPQAELLLSWSSGNALLASRAGYRLGRGKQTTAEPARLRTGDRLALGVSEFDAVLLGLAAAYRAGPVELLLEGTSDLLLGGPSTLESPLRAAAGARYAFSERVALQGMAELGLSERPSLGPDAPLIPIEPRWNASLGVRIRFDTAPQEAAAAAPVPPPVPAKLADPAPPPPARAEVRVRVVDAQGTPVPDAVVELEIDQRRQSLAASEPGGYAGSVELGRAGAPRTSATVAVSAPGFVPLERTAELAPGAEVEIEMRLEAATLPAQLRGLVRSFDGKGVKATIVIQPLGLEATCDADGFFEIDVPPGAYDVVIRAEGYAEQTRKTKVEASGVTVLNADLRRTR